MKLLRPVLTVGCCVAAFIAHAAEPLPADAKCAALPSLQGAWEGVMVGDRLQKKVIVTIKGDSLHFHRDRNFWFETTVILPAGKNPRQLHATITGRSPAQPIDAGRVVRAFFKLEDETLTLATMGDDAEETPQGFAAAVGNRYEFRKVPDKGLIRPESPSVPPPKKYSQPPKPDTDSFRFEKRPKPAEKSEK